jgi:YHS domain-containing protein
MLRTSGCLMFPAVCLTTLYITGCSRDSRSPNPEKPQAPATTNASQRTDEDHGHQAGAHGGRIVPIGRDSYHAEAVFEAGGALKLYMLGKDESRVIDVQRQTLTAYVRAQGDTQAISMSLKPEPQPGDAAGMTSRFVGRLPDGMAGQPVEVTIPSITIAGERFRIGFASVTEIHADDIMPDKVADEDEKKLYLTPGGKYSEADIQANGNVTASQKFKGFKASHDLKPKPGSKICPVTLTKANPQCAWIIGGKTYEFCCPPCVDEFVSLAKTNPEEVRSPEDYVKR